MVPTLWINRLLVLGVGGGRRIAAAGRIGSLQGKINWPAVVQMLLVQGDETTWDD